MECSTSIENGASAVLALAPHVSKIAVMEERRSFGGIGEDGSVNENAIGRAGDLVHPDTKVDAVVCETEAGEGVWRYRRQRAGYSVQMLGIEHDPYASTAVAAVAGRWAGVADA